MRNRRLQQRACRAGKIWMKAEAAGHRSIGHIPAAERGMQTLFSQCEFLARFIVPRPFARFMAIDEYGIGAARFLHLPWDEPALSMERAGVTSLIRPERNRSEEHTSELQSLMRTSYAVFCLKKKIKHT